MRIITLNANGIRAAARKGFFEWLPHQNADAVCIQETKAQVEQLSADIFWPKPYHCYYHDAVKKGYSGVAIYSKKEPSKIIKNLGWSTPDTEGRYLEAQFGNLSIISLYLPSGSSSEERQLIKFEFLDRFMPLLNEFSTIGRHYIICGDWNIAHKEIDLKNWRGNKKNSGFLPEERAWMDQLIEKNLWNDTFRTLNPNPEQYTWWSNRGQSWSKNVGWRIDYQLSSPNLKDKAQSATIYKDERFSDHAPLIIDYALDL